MSIVQLIDNSKTIKKIWKNFVDENPHQQFGKWFHLRPTSKGVTIVTTHDSRPMRGIHVAKTKLNNVLIAINNVLMKQNFEIENAPWEALESVLAAEKIKERFIAGFRNREFPLQARMISEMSDNSMIKEALGINYLHFAASEVILQEGVTEGGQKIDIVAHDGTGKVFFLELKSQDNKKDSPFEQVAIYVRDYGKIGSKKNKDFEELMKNYPYPIDSIKEYVGYVVIGRYGKKVVRHEAPQNGRAGYIELD